MSWEAKGMRNAQGDMEFDGEKWVSISPSDTRTALDKIIAAVRAYLPPDGMSAEQFISTVIEAVDNPEFNKAMAVKQ